VTVEREAPGEQRYREANSDDAPAGIMRRSLVGRARGHVSAYAVGSSAALYDARRNTTSSVSRGK
jgi:hypothetical protein